MPATSTLTPNNVFSAAVQQFQEAGYKTVETQRVADWSAAHGRIFEDASAVVLLAVYDTWDSLITGWAEAQSTLVDLVSEYFTRTDAKAWDAYLVLLTPAPITSEQRRQAQDIRFDTTRVRKLLAAGDELETLVDVERALMPLMPLRLHQLTQQTSPLEQLPALLAAQGIDQRIVLALIKAYSEGRSIMESLQSEIEKQ